MDKRKLQMTVAQGVALDREIREQEIQLAGIKKALIIEAESRLEEHVPTEGGGSTWSAAGDNGECVAISFPAAKLRSSVPCEGRLIETIREAAGSRFQDLFEQDPRWKPVAEFREKAASLLGKAAAKLIRKMEGPASPQVRWETKQPETNGTD